MEYVTKKPYLGSTRIVVIPDAQIKPDNSIEHLSLAAKYIAEKRPDYVVIIGDWWDMESLSSYDKGKKSFEGRRYRRDIESGNEALRQFTEIIIKASEKTNRQKKKHWIPTLVMTLGNHEERILRVAENTPELDGVISYDDFYTEGWDVYQFLEPVVIDGVAFCHYFTSGIMGRPVSSARALLTKKMMSCVMGHVQDRDIAYGKRADGVRLTGLFVGLFTAHDEDYLGPQGNNSWRGIWMLNQVSNGSFDEMPISLDYLQKNYRTG